MTRARVRARSSATRVPETPAIITAAVRAGARDTATYVDHLIHQDLTRGVDPQPRFTIPVDESIHVLRVNDMHPDALATLDQWHDASAYLRVILDDWRARVLHPDKTPEMLPVTPVTGPRSRKLFLTVDQIRWLDSAIRALGSPAPTVGDMIGRLVMASPVARPVTAVTRTPRATTGAAQVVLTMSGLSREARSVAAKQGNQSAFVRETLDRWRRCSSLPTVAPVTDPSAITSFTITAEQYAWFCEVRDAHGYRGSDLLSALILTPAPE